MIKQRLFSMTDISYHLPIKECCTIDDFWFTGHNDWYFGGNSSKTGCVWSGMGAIQSVGTAKNVPSGVYFASLKTKYENSVHKILYMK